MRPQAWRLALHRARGDDQVPPWVYPTAHALGTYSSAEGLCTASIARLVDATGQSRRTVIRQLQWLLEHGWIQVLARSNPSGAQIASARILTDGRIPRTCGQPAGEGVTHDTGGVSWVPPHGGVTGDTPVVGRKDLLGPRRAVESLAQALADAKRLPR